MNSRFRGHAALVCGGASGIGATVAAALAAEGARTAVLDLVEPQSLLADVTSFRCDATNLAAVVSTIDRIDSALGGIDVLVNCIHLRGSGATLGTVEGWDREIAVDFESYVYTTRAFCALNEGAQRPAAVVSISSVLGYLIALSQSLSYHCAKAAIEQMTRYFAVRYGPSGIRVNAVLPGLISRGAPEEASGSAAASAYAHIAREVPLRRSGSSTEVAEAILFLASDQASFITGVSLTVDGGLAVCEQTSIAARIPVAPES